VLVLEQLGDELESLGDQQMLRQRLREIAFITKEFSD